MPEELLSKCKSQKWGAVKVVSGLKEGRSIFSCRNIKKGEFICNYGGKILLNHMLIGKKCLFIKYVN